MKIKDGEIIPRVGISNIKLGISREDLLNIIGCSYEERVREDDSIIKVENAKFWIANDGKVDQIGLRRIFTENMKISLG
jgi:hypothetical protein